MHHVVLGTFALCGPEPAVASDAASQPAAETLQEIVILQDGDLTVRLSVARIATLADTSWMRIEFENAGEAARTVENAYYRIESERDDLVSGEVRGSGGLSSGNAFDLFPEAYRTTPVSPKVVPARSTHRVVEQPSDYSAALLQLPPERGLRVRASFHMHLDLEKERELQTPVLGVPFMFEWQYPDEAGFAAMRSRLQSLLETPEQIVHRVYILGAYLDVPDVARGVSRQDLLAALSRRTQITLARPDIARHLFARFPNDPAVRDYYLERFRAGDAAAVSDLHVGLWHPSFVEPVATLFESGNHFYPALLVLHEHRDDWRGDAKLVARLSAAVRKSDPRVERSVAELAPEQLAGWAGAVRDLSMTGDRSAIGLLRPALRDRRVLAKLEHLGLASGMPLPPLRVCDSALDAILTILDGSPDAAYGRPGIEGLYSTRDPSTANAIRDRMIADLERRLAAMDHDGGRK